MILVTVILRHKKQNQLLCKKYFPSNVAFQILLKLNRIPFQKKFIGKLYCYIFSFVASIYPLSPC